MSKETTKEEFNGFEYPDIEETADTETKDATSKKDEQDESQESSTEDKTPNKYEVAARDEGWLPQDEWDGDPEDWVDAKEFVHRGELMKRIKQQSAKIHKNDKELDDLKKALKALGEHNKKIAEQEYKRAISDLKKQKVAALEENNHEAVVDIDDRIEELKTSKKEFDAEETTSSKDTEDTNANSMPKEVASWLENKDNKWYHTDVTMRGAADAIYLKYLDDNPGDFGGALEKVDTTMRRRFPDEFGDTQNKRRGSAVTEATNRGPVTKHRNQKEKTATVKDLDDEQRKVARTFVDQGVFKNMQEYVDQLVELGEL